MAADGGPAGFHGRWWLTSDERSLLAEAAGEWSVAFAELVSDDPELFEVPASLCVLWLPALVLRRLWAL